MDNSVDILYYESMMESMIEDRKIMELVIESKYANYLLKESTEELAVYEANVFQNIMDAFVKIFERVIQYIKNLLENITNKKFFIADRKLISACNEKIKSLTKEERDNFKLEKIDCIQSAVNSANWVNNQVTAIDQKYNVVVKAINMLLTRSNTKGSEDLFLEREYDKLKSFMVESNTELDKRSNLEEIKKDAKDVSFNDLISILDDYGKSQDTMKKINDSCSKLINRMKSDQRTMTSNINSNRIISKHDQSNLIKYRELVQLMTNYQIGLARLQMNLFIMIFKNEEAILRRFLSYSNNAVDESTLEEYDDFVNEALFFKSLPSDVKELKQELKDKCNEFNISRKELSVSQKLSTAKHDMTNIVKDLIKKCNITAYGHTIMTEYDYGVEIGKTHKIIGVYKDYVISIIFRHPVNNPITNRLSLIDVSVNYDKNNCDIPKNVVIDLLSTLNPVDVVSTTKTSIKVKEFVSPYFKYLKSYTTKLEKNYPNLERKYSDKYDIKKSSSKTIKISMKK